MKTLYYISLVMVLGVACKPKEEPAKKPVLYLYPESTQPVQVQVVLKNHELIHPYPAYNNGWEVIAQPNGTLTNTATGKEHYCLFWEMEGSSIAQQLQEGFVIRGSETASFLEKTLPQLGLNAKETNEFIIFWLPQLENNAYNAIYFTQDQYQAVSKLKITPQPDQTIRVMMLWQALEDRVELPTQKLPPTPTRQGFTAVEWGGQEVKQNFVY